MGQQLRDVDVGGLQACMMHPLDGMTVWCGEAGHDGLSVHPYYNHKQAWKAFTDNLHHVGMQAGECQVFCIRARIRSNQY